MRPPPARPGPGREERRDGEKGEQKGVNEFVGHAAPAFGVILSVVDSAFATSTGAACTGIVDSTTLATASRSGSDSLRGGAYFANFTRSQLPSVSRPSD